MTGKEPIQTGEPDESSEGQHPWDSLREYSLQGMGTRADRMARDLTERLLGSQSAVEYVKRQMGVTRATLKSQQEELDGYIQGLRTYLHLSPEERKLINEHASKKNILDLAYTATESPGSLPDRERVEAVLGSIGQPVFMLNDGVPARSLDLVDARPMIGEHSGRLDLELTVASPPFPRRYEKILAHSRDVVNREDAIQSYLHAMYRDDCDEDNYFLGNPDYEEVSLVALDEIGRKLETAIDVAKLKGIGDDSRVQGAHALLLEMNERSIGNYITAIASRKMLKKDAAWLAYERNTALSLMLRGLIQVEEDAMIKADRRLKEMVHERSEPVGEN